MMRKEKHRTTSRSLFERALTIIEAARGPNHPDLAEYLRALGLYHSITNNYSAARPLLERALVLFEDDYGPRHPQVASSLASLASCQEMPSAALPLLERALSIQEAVLGRQHPDVANCLRAMAQQLQEQGEHAKAKECSKRALAIDQTALGPSHPDTKSAKNQLADIKANKACSVCRIQGVKLDLCSRCRLKYYCDNDAENPW